MKIRVCEYDENVIGIRIAHVDFYQDTNGYVACPFTKGEVEFSNILVGEIINAETMRTRIEELEADVALLVSRQWVSVETRLPGDYQEVYTFDRDALYSSKYECGSYCGFDKDGHPQAQDGEYFWTFTHWMPLPEPPEAR